MIVNRNIWQYDLIERDMYQANLLLAHCILFLLFPLGSLILSIFTFRSSVSQCFFIIYAFYFGASRGPLQDLLNHYNAFLDYDNKPLDVVWSYWNKHGKEPWHKLFKIIVAQFSMSPKFFAGTAAAVYASFFILFFRQLKQFYKENLGPMQILVLCALVLTVEFFWYSGLRYWNGAFFFCAFYMRYLTLNENKYLYISCLSILFHFALISVIVAALLNHVLKKQQKIKVVLALISIPLKSISLVFVQKVLSLNYMSFLVKDHYIENAKRIGDSTWTYMVRTGQANMVYQSRWDILFYSASIILFILWRRNKNLFKEGYTNLFGFLLVLYFITNLSYVEITMYQRIYKLLILMLFVYVFIKLSDFDNKWINYSYISIILFTPVVLYELATPLVAVRESILDFELWFSNIFIWLSNLIE